MRYLSHTEAKSGNRLTTFYKVEADVVREARRVLRMKAYLPHLNQSLSHYEKDGKNAGELQRRKEESKEEKEIDRLRACAGELCETAKEIARCKKYRLLKPLRTLRRWRGTYNLPEDPQDFVDILQYQAFLEDWKHFS